MSSCSNLATKAELNALEAEVDILKASLEALKSEFNSHKNQDIPQAHQYDSNLQVSTSYQGEKLTVTVSDASSSGNDSCTIPEFKIEKFTIEQALNGKALDTSIYLNDYKSDASTSLETLLAFIPPGEGLTLGEVLAAVRPLIAAAVDGLKILIEIAREETKTAKERADEALSLVGESPAPYLKDRSRDVSQRD